MIGWDAIEEMREDQTARFRCVGCEYRFSGGRLELRDMAGIWVQSEMSVIALARDDWERVTPLLTDDELVAKLEKARTSIGLINPPYYQSAAYNDALGAVLQCMTGLRERIAAKGGGG